MTLEQTLAEVGPIFNGRSFPQASMQDVMTAKQFAKEIAAKNLDIREAYILFWSSFLQDRNLPKTIAQKWRPMLTRLAPMLSTEDAKTYVETISDSYFVFEKNFTKKEGAYDFFLMDLELCAPYIGTVIPDSEGRGKEIIEELVRHATSYGLFVDKSKYELDCAFERMDIARYALSLTKSKLALEKLIEFMRLCDKDLPPERELEAIFVYEPVKNLVLKGLGSYEVLMTLARWKGREILLHEGKRQNYDDA